MVTELAKSDYIQAAVLLHPSLVKVDDFKGMAVITKIVCDQIQLLLCWFYTDLLHYAPISFGVLSVTWIQDLYAFVVYAIYMWAIEIQMMVGSLELDMRVMYSFTPQFQSNIETC